MSRRRQAGARHRPGGEAAGRLRRADDPRPPRRPAGAGPFAYRHLGNLATIGRSAAVIDFGRIELKGWIAWWIWGIAHIYFLIGTRSRLAVAISWLWSFLSGGHSARLITQRETLRAEEQYLLPHPPGRPSAIPAIPMDAGARIRKPRLARTRTPTPPPPQPATLGGVGHATRTARSDSILYRELVRPSLSGGSMDSDVRSWELVEHLFDASVSPGAAR